MIGGRDVEESILNLKIRDQESYIVLYANSHMTQCSSPGSLFHKTALVFKPRIMKILGAQHVKILNSQDTKNPPASRSLPFAIHLHGSEANVATAISRAPWPPSIISALRYPPLHHSCSANPVSTWKTRQPWRTG